ncbi:hypothetical protein [Hymenobacter arizonensis]|uniref:Uncharacterized protein n=1 Tax=Hymenobacter arizonensis TaxID=1227077 RepID=A0A1I6B8R2_HYMAR|nr:hypothetical protein [Hymenobacter arizonensis]SFQ77294.1 hypothetical protein SAMN04515668_4291 [Hymenobacter arizonensis]
MNNPIEGLKTGLLKTTGLLLLPLLLTACDSTPRERQEVTREGVRELDTLARKAGERLSNVGKAAATYDASNRARRKQPLDPRKEIAMEDQLMGPYSGQLDNLTPADLPNAYAQLIRSARTQRTTWTDRDWDYARAVYKRLNDQAKQVSMDIPARDEVRIRARQAEFVALQAGRTAEGLKEASKRQAQASK